MAKYNNSAGRILTVLEPLSAKNGQNIAKADVAKAFQVSEGWSAILAAVDDLQSEYRALVDEIEQFREKPTKYELYKQNLPEIEKSIYSFNLMLRDGHVNFSILPTAIVALRFIAADLPEDESADVSDLERIRQLVDELRNEIEATSEFSKALREWLLELVRVIRDSLDRFAIRGSRGMRRQLSILVGELMQSYDNASKVKEQKPSIWGRLTEAMDLMHKLASLAEKCRPAVTFVMKTLPFLKNLALPAPNSDPMSHVPDDTA